MPDHRTVTARRGRGSELTKEPVTGRSRVGPRVEFPHGLEHLIPGQPPVAADIQAGESPAPLLLTQQKPLEEASIFLLANHSIPVFVNQVEDRLRRVSDRGFVGLWVLQGGRLELDPVLEAGPLLRGHLVDHLPEARQHGFEVVVTR